MTDRTRSFDSLAKYRVNLLLLTLNQVSKVIAFPSKIFQREVLTHFNEKKHSKYFEVIEVGKK